tara:strand:- start:1250 stop:1696 length:447 start_codon:yes stop_codon:yes gene_type:complete
MQTSPDSQAARIRRNSAAFSGTAILSEDDINKIASSAVSSYTTTETNDQTDDDDQENTPHRRATAPPTTTTSSGKTNPKNIRRMRGRILQHKSTIQRANSKQKQKNVERMSQYVKSGKTVASGNSEETARLENTSIKIADWLSKQHQA